MQAMRRTFLPLALALALMLGLLLTVSSRPADAQQEMNPREYFKTMDAKYKDIVGKSGEDLERLGVAQYERFKWFNEKLYDPQTGLPVPGARMNAFAQEQKAEHQYGSRSSTWYNDGPANVSGRCLAIAVHPTIPTTAYAGFADGGIWKTTDGGTTWTPLDDLLPTLAVSAIKIDANNTNRIWIGTGESANVLGAVDGVGLLVTTDGGATWNASGYTYNQSEGHDINAIEYNPSTGTLILAANNGLWRSTDQGANFTQLYTQGWNDIKMKIGSNTIWFASSTTPTPGPGFYVSHDDGATWTMTYAPPAMYNNRFALTDADPNYIYWGMDIGNNLMSIYKSTDAAASFTEVFSGTHYGDQGCYNISISVDPTNKNSVYSGGIVFYRSTNGGTTFADWGEGVHVDHHAATWSPSDNTNLWLGSDGGVWRSTNSGSSFVDKNLGLITTQYYAISTADSRPARALGGSQDNGTWRYDNGPNWTNILGGDGFQCEIDRQHPDTLYCELYYGEHYRSYDGGATLTSIPVPEQGPWETPTLMDYANSAILWTAHNESIYKSTDRGSHWVSQNTPAGFGGGLAIDQCRAHPEVMILASQRNIVWLTTDSGASWTDRTSGLVMGSNISDVACAPNDPLTFVVTVSTYSTTGHQIYKTTDQGVTWTPLDGTLPEEPVNTVAIDPSNPSDYFIGTDNAVWVSLDAGTTFSPFNTGLPHVWVTDLRINDDFRILRAGTYGRGVWEVDISNVVPTAVNNPVRPEIRPLTLRILGNPAGDHALLRFGMRQAGQANLALYDLQGRVVRNLMNKFHYAHMDNVSVSLKDLPSGVYFARLDANGAHASEKLVVEH